jgi:septal ring factor EnvC (AmiA/AmiB activator)
MARPRTARIAAEIERLVEQLAEARREEAALTTQLAELDAEHDVLATRLARLNEELAAVSRQCAAAVAVLRPEFGQPLSLKRELVLAIFAGKPLDERQKELVATALATA